MHQHAHTDTFNEISSIPEAVLTCTINHINQAAMLSTGAHRHNFSDYSESIKVPTDSTFSITAFGNLRKGFGIPFLRSQLGDQN